MLQADVTAARWQQDSDGAWLCLRVQSPTSAMTICDEMKPDKQYVAQIKRKAGALTQMLMRGFCWINWRHTMGFRGMMCTGKKSGSSVV